MFHLKIIFFLLCISFSSILIVAQEGDDDSLGPEGEKVVVPPDTDYAISINSNRGSITVESDHDINIYVVKDGETHPGEKITTLVCANSSRCCFDAQETFVLENVHTDVQAIVYYARVSSCKGVSTGVVITYFWVGLLLVLGSIGGIMMCFSKAGKCWSILPINLRPQHQVIYNEPL
jgi:hypothetical protein